MTRIRLGRQSKNIDMVTEVEVVVGTGLRQKHHRHAKEDVVEAAAEIVGAEIEAIRHLPVELRMKQ
jgi:hypothetical protein